MDMACDSSVSHMHRAKSHIALHTELTSIYADLMHARLLEHMRLNGHEYIFIL